MPVPPFDNHNTPIIDVHDVRVPLNYFNIVKLRRGQVNVLSCDCRHDLCRHDLTRSVRRLGIHGGGHQQLIVTHFQALGGDA